MIKQYYRGLWLNIELQHKTQQWKVAPIRLFQRMFEIKQKITKIFIETLCVLRETALRDNSDHIITFKSMFKLEYSLISSSTWLRRDPRPTTGAHDWTLYRYPQIIGSSTVRQNLRIFNTKKLATSKLWTVNILFMFTTENYIFSHFLPLNIIKIISQCRCYVFACIYWPFRSWNRNGPRN